MTATSGAVRPGSWPSAATFEWEGFEGTGADWAERLGISRGAFNSRVKKWGDNNPRTFRPHYARAPLPEDPVYTYQGESHTGAEWAEILGITRQSFFVRVRRWGTHDPRTFLPPGARPKRVGARRLRTVEIAGDPDASVVTRADSDDRAALLADLLEACPELRSHATSDDAEVTACVFVDFFGRMSFEEIGEVLGCSRERVRQVTEIALKKVKLAWGAAGREAWEHSQERATHGHWDEAELHGFDG